MTLDDILASLFPEGHDVINDHGLLLGSGPLRGGGRAVVTPDEVPPGGKGMVFKPRVLAVEPERELRWKGRLLFPGLFDGEHRFRITPNNGGVRFRQSETFTGLFVALMPTSVWTQTKTGFEAMNEALKQRAEDHPP